ncbi:MAG: ArsC/Spx/MgsR family protein [Gemmatimonadota bacterium]
MDVQIFGRKKGADSRKVLRFFSERRIRTHFVDIDRKPPSRRELRRFAERYGAEAVIDRGSARYEELGLRAAHLSAERVLERAEEEPRLLRTPLVRWRQRLSIGHDPEAFKTWVAEEGGS